MAILVAMRIPRSAIRGLVTFLLYSCLPSLQALETTLIWTVGKDRVVLREVIEPTEAGWSARIDSSVGERDMVLLDRSRNTLEWRRTVDSVGTDLVAIREGRRVRVSGKLEGRPYDRVHDFGELPWYQFQEFSYEFLHASSAASSEFWTMDRRTLKPSRFSVERRGAESIGATGAPVEAVRYSLTAGGVPALLFSADLWLRKTDGRMLRLEVPALPGVPRSVVELAGESPYKESK